MRHFARLLTLGLVTVFVAGCWSEPIKIRSADENDTVPYASHSKEHKALLKKLGKAPAPAEGAEKKAEGAEKH